MEDNFDLLQSAYDPETFRRRGYELVDLLANYLGATLNGKDPKTLRWQLPEEQYRQWSEDAENGPHTDPGELFGGVLAGSVHLHNPCYMGHQISPPAPVAALAGLLGDFLNNGMGVYEMGAPSTAIERVVVRETARRMGLASSADGVLTSGGSLANLTALLTARSVKGGAEVWQHGHRQPLALLVSEEAHYCVDRAVRIMGWGEDGIIKVPVDAHYRMRTDLLEGFLQSARSASKKVIAVVGSAGSTSTGSFDDLEAIGDFCQKHGLWFHVDGAHGAAAALSDRYRHLVRGIDRADSVVMDFHKMLVTPSVTTALVYREGNHSYATFSQKGQYLWSSDEEAEWFNLAKRTFECTKLMLSVRAYSIIRTHGWEFFQQYVTRVIDLGRQLGAMVLAHPALELAVPPEGNIVCFRFRSPQLEEPERSLLNERIRQCLLEDGTFYVVQTRLKGENWLRTTLTNPFTTATHLEELLERVVELASTKVPAKG